MDSLGSLALATEGPSKDVLKAKPVHRCASLVTPGMLRNVCLVSGYQIIIILLSMFDGVGDTFTIMPSNLYDNEIGTMKTLRTTYRYTVIYNFFIFV